MHSISGGLHDPEQKAPLLILNAVVRLQRNRCRRSLQKNHTARKNRKPRPVVAKEMERLSCQAPF